MSYALCAITISAQELTLKAGKNGKVGYTDATGSVIIKQKYDIGLPFNDGVARVSRNEKWGLVNTNGKEVVKCEWSELKLWAPGIWLIKKGKDKYGLVSSEGKVLLKPEYSRISPLNSHGRAIVTKGGKITKANNGRNYLRKGKHGVVDADGQLLVPTKWLGMWEFSTQGEVTTKRYGTGLHLTSSMHILGDTLETDCEYLGVAQNATFDKFGVIDGKDGKFVMPIGKYWYVSKPSSGKIRWWKSGKRKSSIGYYDIGTKQDMTVREIEGPLTDVNYWTHGDFTGSIAPVNSTDGWYFIDRNGSKVRGGYKRLNHNQFANIWAAYPKSGGCDFLDCNGRQLFVDQGLTQVEFPDYRFDSRYMAVAKGESWGIIDTLGATILPFDYEKTRAPQNGIAFVCKEGKWGAINISDKSQKVPCQYLNIKYSLTSDPATFWVMSQDSLWHNFVVASQQLQPEGYDNVYAWVEGYAWVHPKGMTGIDTPLNRAQLGIPPTDTKDQTFSSYVNDFGYIVGEDGRVYFNQPLATQQIVNVRNLIHQKGDRPLTQAEIHQTLLQLTRNNRSYLLSSKIPASDWDF